MSLLESPAGRSAAYPGRVRNGAPGSSRWVTYPDPYFDIAGTFMPEDLKALFKWCRYYAVTDPFISAALHAMSEYPITPIVVDEDNEGVRTLWERYFEEELELRSKLIDINLYMYTYGIAYLSLFFAFTKMLKCGTCGYERPAKNSKFRYRQHRYEFECPKCGNTGPAESYDQPHKTTKGARLLMWEPDAIDVVHNEISGSYRFYYTPPTEIVNAVKMGDRDTVIELPRNFLEAIRKKVKIEISRDNIYVLKRPTMMTSRKSKGLGAPLILNVLKQVFHVAIMRKAQEAMLTGRVLPLDVIFPQQSAANVNPYEMVNLSQWRDTVIGEINKWRRDPLYMPVMPLPLGHQNLGGDARMLMLTNDIRAEYEMILAAMGVPHELIFGGLSYSGSNVSLRIVENRFLSNRAGLTQMIRRFVIRRTSARMGWPLVEAHMKAFKMADDLQRKAFLFELNQLGKVSDDTLLQETDLNPDEEDGKIKREASIRVEALKRTQLAEAEIMGEVQELQARYQVKAEAAMAEERQQMASGVYGQAPGEPGIDGMGSPVDPRSGQGAGGQGAQQIVQQISQMPPESQQMTIQRIEQQSPQLAQYVRSALGSQGGGGGQSSAGKPLPEQLPPRRGPESASI